MRTRLRKAESGAMAIFIALTTCFVVIPLGALAVDIGMQRMSRVDSQAVADTTALDMARLLASGGAVTDAAATASASRNSGAIGNGMTVKAYTGTLSGTFVSDQSLGCNGTVSNAYFTQTSSSPTAVLVVVSNSVNFAINSGTGGVCRSAIADAYQQACMTMDSYAAAINTGDSTALGALNKLLGTNINASVLSSSGILTAGVNVLDFLNILKTNLSLGTVDQVLTANVTAAQVVSAAVSALNNSGNTLSANALQSIGATINSSGSVAVGTLLGLSQGQGSALGAVVNPLDLLTAAVQLANGTNALAVSVTTPSGSGLSGISASATVGSHPQLVCLNAGTKTMAQTSLNVSANFSAPGSLTGALTNLVNGLNGVLSGVLNLLGGLLGGDTYDLPQVSLGAMTVNLKLATASGRVDSLTCVNGKPTAMNVHEGSALAPTTISFPITISETRHYGGVLGIGRKTETKTSTLTVTITTVPPGDQSVPATMNLPADYDVPKAGPSGNLSLGGANVSAVLTSSDGQFSNGYFLVNQLLSGATSVVTQLTSNLITPLETVVIQPLLDAMTTTLKNTIGLTIAGSTYTAKPTASCNTPKLAG